MLYRKRTGMLTLFGVAHTPQEWLKIFETTDQYKPPKKVRDSVALQVANMERAVRNEQVEAKKSPRFDSPVSILIHSRRCRLTDADGVSAKAAIDGLVKAGVLQDDSQKYVKEVRYSQEKVKTKAEEQTVITIVAL